MLIYPFHPFTAHHPDDEGGADVVVRVALDPAEDHWRAAAKHDAQQIAWLHPWWPPTYVPVARRKNVLDT